MAENLNAPRTNSPVGPSSVQEASRFLSGHESHVEQLKDRKKVEYLPTHFHVDRAFDLEERPSELFERSYSELFS